MKLARVFGIQITLNHFFLVMLMVYGILGFLTQVLAVFAIVLFHELAHAVVASGYGLHVREIEVLPFGGVARIDGLIEADPKIETHVALAGPLNNFLLAGIILIFERNGIISQEVAGFPIVANIALGLFNLLPIVPLDGGRVFRAYLAKRKGYRRAAETAAAVGKALALALGVVSTAGLYFGYSNFHLVVLCLFLYFSANKEKGMAPYVFVRYLVQKKEELKYRNVLPTEELVALEKTPLKEIVRCFVPKKYHIILVVDEKLRLVGIATEVDIVDGLFERGIDVPVGEIARR